MISLFMSALVLIVPLIVGLFVSIYLWRRGLLGRMSLLVMLVVAAVEVHSTVNSHGKIKKKYAEITFI